MRAVVLTGASSGVARACAHAFARTGARLVLAARGAAALEEVAAECRALGATAVVFPVDVSDADAVMRLREAAVTAFGRIDVWVNCAAVLCFGRFEEIPPDVFRRVIEVNVFGYANGARAALAQFRAQERGVLINVGSVLGTVGEPFVSPYVTSKFAIRGFTACLRQELRDAPEIHACAVLPAALDTPMYQHAANFSGWPVRSIVPVYDVHKVARAVVRLAERPRAIVVVSGFGHLVSIVSRLAPILLERAVARIAPKLQFDDGVAPRFGGNSDAPLEGRHATEGGWRTYWRKRLIG